MQLHTYVVTAFGHIAGTVRSFILKNTFDLHFYLRFSFFFKNIIKECFQMIRWMICINLNLVLASFFQGSSINYVVKKSGFFYLNPGHPPPP